MEMCSCLERTLANVNNPTIPQVTQVLRSLDCNIKRVTPYITAPVAPLTYGRNVIYESELFEVIVLHLPPFIETPIHDHGLSFCCVKIVSGVLINRIYQVSNDQKTPTLTEEFIYQTDEYFHVPKDQIHSMYNPTPDPLVTFHIYSPPIRNNHYFPHTKNPQQISP
jgi:cysteine dioxygenase